MFVNSWCAKKLMPRQDEIDKRLTGENRENGKGAGGGCECLTSVGKGRMEG